jgi:hypothetical protein
MSMGAGGVKVSGYFLQFSFIMICRDMSLMGKFERMESAG